ncbi:GGDEF domain-containing protein [Shinella daejeonensis]|uniref:GGDEF domain-containing protein n=1 Tax=Shinella daejeonensis TaxID=659017 RepID=UPI0020C7AABD|nr:GGDEF domain-containing protein [Shinella daejeonensis]MCP8894125.1 GGDEF domain-containing protein [Shinella daejeonensis]
MLVRLARIRAWIALNPFRTGGDIPTLLLDAVLMTATLSAAVCLAGAAIFDYLDLPHTAPYASRPPADSPANALAVAGVLALLGWLLVLGGRKLARLRSSLDQLRDRDDESGLLNRVAFERALDVRLRRGFLMLLDIDCFDLVKERHGREAGGAAVMAVADELLRIFPQPHLAGRIGDATFAIFIRTDVRDDARLLVEEARRSIASRKVTEGEAVIRVTVSTGVADGRDPQPPGRLFDAAERALHLARSYGRNRVVYADETEKLPASRKQPAGGRRRTGGAKAKAMPGKVRSGFPSGIA